MSINSFSQTGYYQVNASAFQSFLKRNRTDTASNQPFSLFPSPMPSTASNINREVTELKEEGTKELELFRRHFNQECQQLVREFLLTQENDLYALYPSLADIKTPLRDCLEQDRTIQELSRKYAVKTFRPSRSGLSGRVKIVRFANDPIENRLFAIKRPNKLSNIFGRLSSQVKDDQAAMKYYKNNLVIASKIGLHPNFMQVHGVIVKEKKQGQSSKPYLIMEYIEGQDLNRLEELSPSDIRYLANQLKEAFTRLYECRIIPRDANNGNFIVTSDKVIKMIDFDAWQYLPDASPQEVGQALYSLFCRVVATLQKKTDEKIDLDLPVSQLSLTDGNIFIEELDALIARLPQ